MSHTRLRRSAAPALALAGLLLALAAPGPALAKPPARPGPVTGLAMTLTKPADNFTVAATWNAATGATTYDVALTNAANGAAIASASVGTTSWTASVNLTGVTTVRLTVAGKNQRSGPAASITQAVPDLNAPTGTYTTAWVDRTGTITQTALTDDGPVGQITRTVNWGDGSAAEAWTKGDKISHLYAADGLYRPTVTLTDGVGNTRVVVVPAIVPGDKTAPTGKFSTGPSTVWAGVTAVNLTQTALHDDFSPASYVLRWINWGDGSPVAPWTESVTATHVYADGGAYTPKVILKDEAGNTSEVDAEAVKVTADTVKPVVTIKAPGQAVADEVGSWKRLAGQATDTKGSGVAGVAVRAIEKRGASWYFYKATTKTWAKAGTKAKAWKRAKAVAGKLDTKGAWVARLAGLRKGTLVLKATATDASGNVSKPVVKKAVLTAS